MATHEATAIVRLEDLNPCSGQITGVKTGGFCGGPRGTAPDFPPYTAGTETITYQVNDGSNPSQPIAAAGMSANESFTPISNGCTHVANTPTPSGGQTFSNGTFGPDTLGGLCSISCLPADGNDHPTGSCSLQFGQTWTVNGLAVQTKTLTYTCQSVGLQ